MEDRYNREFNFPDDEQELDIDLDEEFYEEPDEETEEIDDDIDDDIRINHPRYSDEKNSVKRDKKEDNPTVLEEILSFVKIIVAAVIVAFIFSRFVIVNAEVPTGSMRTTIVEGDRLIGLRLSYIFSEPKRGDIVIFKYPDNENENFVKRVIGVPGDVIQIYNGHVYVNDEMLIEDYILEPMEDDGEVHTYVVPANHYFMMGDNRNNSKDSRYWTNTYVSKDKILAKVFVRYYSGNDKKISFSLF